MKGLNGLKGLKSLKGLMLEIKEVKTGLYSASGYIRKKLAEILNMRSTPELHFEYDDLVEKGDRVFELLKQEEEKRKQKENNNGQ